MSILSRFARSKPSEQAPEGEQETECAHWELAPRWGNAADIGKEDKITSYACTSCGMSMTPPEARALRDS